MANAPTPADIGRVYLNGTTRVMLLNDMAVAVAGGYEVAVKQVEPNADGEWPVTEVDYRHLTTTDERIDPLDMPITDEASARAFIREVTR